MEQEKLKFLAEYMSNISPELWEITLAYIHSAAIQWAIGSMACVLILVVCLVAIRKTKDDEARGILLFISVALIILAVTFLGSALGRFNSPDMYAVRYLLNMVP